MKKCNRCEYKKTCTIKWMDKREDLKWHNCQRFIRVEPRWYIKLINKIKGMRR